MLTEICEDHFFQNGNLISIIQLIKYFILLKYLITLPQNLSCQFFQQKVSEPSETEEREKLVPGQLEVQELWAVQAG